MILKMHTRNSRKVQKLKQKLTIAPVRPKVFKFQV